MANSGPSLDWAVSQGANAIETDLQFDNRGNPYLFEHRGFCDCSCPHPSGHICAGGLGSKCSGSSASQDADAHLQHIARLSNIALVIIDSKVESKMASRLGYLGKSVVALLDRDLFNYGFKGKVIIGCGKINTYDYLQAAAEAAKLSPNANRYFFSFDQEDDRYFDVIAMLSRFTNNRVYGTGISSCVPGTYYTGISQSVAGKAAGQHGMNYIWTLDKKSSMRTYIELGVQGIITNRVDLARTLAISMGLKLATPSSSIPVATDSLPSPNKCDCDYHKGGCTISWPAPSLKACKCKYKGAWTCGGSLVSCDVSRPKCSRPDESKEACQLGGGDCDAY
ncbi:unnamed protein product [Rotaria sp. Silwood1]|nr:unnamed protein product [Rotaria sp. Silwood1]CAF4794196.1 unnamed protein product [Rotaria sp. Silwood1]